jgi:hypothetical protein
LITRVETTRQTKKSATTVEINHQALKNVYGNHYCNPMNIAHDDPRPLLIG